MVQKQSVSQSLTQADTGMIAQIPRPVCGIYFGSAEGLHQHLHRKHADVEQASKIKFNRATHSLFGLPYCRFCRKRLGTWQSLTKHITQGTCLRVKLAVGMGQSIDQLLEEIQAEETRDPPQPPVGDQHSTQRSFNESDLRSIIEDTPVQDMAKHSSQLILFASTCLLCGQRLKQATRMKAHWQSSHQGIWERVRHHALSEAQSLSAIMRTPCVYCGSKAKNSKEHAKQCPMLFQALSVKQIRREGASPLQGADSKPMAPRKTEAAPKYKAFVSPLEQAFNHGTRGSTKVIWTSTTSRPDPDKAPQSTAMPIRTIASMKQARENAGTIKQFFQPRPEERAQLHQSDTRDAPWYCRLRLRNMHAMCYLNAGFPCLVARGQSHRAGTRGATLSFRRWATTQHPEVWSLTLPRMNGIRKLAPRWDFDPEQKDVAELLHEMFDSMRTMQVIWDTRVSTDAVGAAANSRSATDTHSHPIHKERSCSTGSRHRLESSWWRRHCPSELSRNALRAIGAIPSARQKLWRCGHARNATDAGVSGRFERTVARISNHRRNHSPWQEPQHRALSSSTQSPDLMVAH